MPLESIEVSTVLPASAERIYRAWLDSVEHSAFTGGQAVVDATVGGRHTAWDGYIEGVTLELEPGRRIVQSWRSEDFPDDADDSRVEVRFEESGDGTHVTIVHSDIPEGQGEDYRRGWVDHYFAPMARYFGAAPADAAAAVTAAPSEDLSAGWEDDALTPVPSLMKPAETIAFEEEVAVVVTAPKAKPAAAKKPTPKPAAKPKAAAKAKKPAAAKAKAKAKKPAAKAKAKAKKPAAKAKAKAKKPAAKAKPKAKAKAKPKPKKAAKKKGKR